MMEITRTRLFGMRWNLLFPLHRFRLLRPHPTQELFYRILFIFFSQHRLCRRWLKGIVSMINEHSIMKQVEQPEPTEKLKRKEAAKKIKRKTFVETEDVAEKTSRREHDKSIK